MQAERDRRRLPARSPWALWTRRILGLLATAAFLGVGFAIYDMVRPEGTDSVGAAVTSATPTATPKAKKSKSGSKQKTTKPKPLTKSEKRARETAVDTIREQGDTTLRAEDYDPRARLRVLIGRPVGDATGGYTAYFFTKDGFLDKDAQFRSSELKVAKQGKATITLRYGVYKDGDKAGSPSGTKRVRFRLDGTSLTALDTVPAADERFQRTSS
ncbi:LppP/LprE family lipoprotein [Solirubrobacter phytolaccae]|uniref:LppP/LprE family lipoprotein n=1 Tax=Solirubrobacter phytolaccae TaxID=1404360 RepID=A0A9X3S8T4_9ACTN|nr:LppP/LprE family lipoprotein [Solirubrobacter phytolaccae]MDA0180726.1 LppP/LprE family lipoprotein [Solirubrobacter phytolaccae]